MTLAQLQQLYLDEQNGILPQDDPLAGKPCGERPPTEETPPEEDVR